MWRKGSLLVLAIVVVSLLEASSAHAAFPGQNGRIAFEDNPFDAEVRSINPDGTGEANLTNHPSGDSAPVWSPDGRKLAFVGSRSGNDEIHTMNADGTGVVRLTNDPGRMDVYPAWSPDGQKIVWVKDLQELWIMNADGTGANKLMDVLDYVEHPAWSPDGSKIAFTRTICDEFGCDQTDVWTINPDGSGFVKLIDWGIYPDWSPDGQRIVYTKLNPVPTGIAISNADGSGQTQITTGSQRSPTFSPDGSQLAFVAQDPPTQDNIYRMNVDGTGVTQVTNTTTRSEGRPDWQPIPYQSSPTPPYDHPRLAGPIRFSIVPNFRQTISNSQCTARGGLNSTHGPPLAFASCNPPGFVPGTIAHMGPGSSSWASYGVIYGDTNTSNGDQANVTLRASLNDIRTAGGADYPASLSLVTKLRITDRLNGGSQSDPATVADFDYSTPVSCAATAGAEGATCNLDTSADAVAAGAIKENKATVLQVFRFRVNDSGANGTRGDADDRTFANQGIYIP